MITLMKSSERLSTCPATVHTHTHTHVPTQTLTNMGSHHTIRHYVWVADPK